MDKSAAISKGEIGLLLEHKITTKLSQHLPEIQNGAVPKIFFLIADHWANSWANCTKFRLFRGVWLMWQTETAFKRSWLIVLLSQFFICCRGLKDLSAVQDDTGDVNISRTSCSTAVNSSRTSGTIFWNAIWASAKDWMLNLLLNSEAEY